MATRAPSPPVQQYQPPAPAARPPTPPPKDGPDYKRCLGKGGFGAVYAGKWKGEDVAYKVIDLAGEHESIFELANRELETLKEATRLIPEYVINIKSWYEEGEKLFIVMEKACCDLLMWVQNKRKGDAGLSLSVWNGVAVDIVTALSEFHRHGFIHKDIKPRNILVTRDSEGWAVMKLGDLGLSKKLGATTSRCVTGGRRRATGTGAGTPAYMAPEQKYTRKLTLAADIWACAVVLVEIKTGVYPYSHDDESDDPFDERHFKSFPPALKKTLQECLSLQPCKRPSAKKLLDALLQRDNEE